jgi:hypothetical protein
MVEKDTEVTEDTERFSHRDTETRRHVDLCVSVSPWQIFSVSSDLSVSEAGG